MNPQTPGPQQLPPPQPSGLPPLSGPAATPPSAQQYQAVADTTSAAGNQFSVDYLNQIAPPMPQKTINRFAVFGMIAGVIALGVFLMVVMTGSGRPDVSSQTKLIQARIATLQSVTAEQQKHLKQNELVSVNATLSTTLTSMMSSLDDLKKAQGIKSVPLVQSTTEKAYQTSLSGKFNDAYLTGTLDRTYAGEMAYQLAILKSMVQKLTSISPNSQSIKTFHESSIPSIDVASKQFSDFSASK